MNSHPVLTKRILKPKSIIWHFILWIQGAGILTVLAPSGLDLGYNWAVTNATRNQLFSEGQFVGPYGPLGFLEFAYPDWSMGFLLSIIWKIALSSVLLEMLAIVLHKYIKQTNFCYLIALILVTVTNALNMPNILLVIIFMMRAILNIPWIQNQKNLEPLIDSVFLVVALLIKPLPFLLISLFTLTYYINKEKIKRNIITLACYSTIFLLTALFLMNFQISNLEIWVRGYLEISKGYTEMSNEEAGRLVEYPMFLLLAIYAIYKLKKVSNSKTVTLASVFLYFVFRYGFNRHDGHSITSFTILAFLLLAISLKSNNQDRTFVYLGFIFVLLVSGFNLGEILNTTNRAQNSYLALKMIVDPSFRNAENSNAKKLATDTLQIPNSISSYLSGREVSLLPLPEDISYLGAKLSLPPISQLFSAYTPWLDEFNAEWISSSRKPELLLLRPPTTIDGRYPWWDSPRFWVEALCNYETQVESENWLLLVRREKSLCTHGNMKLSSKGSGGQVSFSANEDSSIRILALDQNQTFMQKSLRFIFKPLKPDMIRVNGESFRLVWNNQNYLPVYIPDSINLPGRWRLAPVQEIQTSNHTQYQVFKIPVTQ